MKVIDNASQEHLSSENHSLSHLDSILWKPPASYKQNKRVDIRHSFQYYTTQSRRSTGSMVEQSIIRDPLMPLEKTPSAPRNTPATCAVAGSMVMIVVDAVVTKQKMSAPSTITRNAKINYLGQHLQQSSLSEPLPPPHSPSRIRKDQKPASHVDKGTPRKMREERLIGGGKTYNHTF